MMFAQWWRALLRFFSTLKIWGAWGLEGEKESPSGPLCQDWLDDADAPPALLELIRLPDEPLRDENAEVRLA